MVLVYYEYVQEIKTHTDMIVTLILNLMFIIIVGAVKLLPDISSTSTFTDIIKTASGYISSIYSFLPVITIAILGILFLDLVIESSYFIYKVIYWILKKLPFIK